MNELALPATGALSIEHARDLIAKSKSADETLRYRAIAKAMLVYQRERDAGLESVADAKEIVLRATRRIGEQIKEEGEQGRLAKGRQGQGRPHLGGSKTDPPKRLSPPVPTLADRGIDKHLADEARQLAAMPAKAYEGLVARVREQTIARQTLSSMRRDAKHAERIADIAAISESNEPLTDKLGTFPVLYADPPWRYEHAVSKSRAIENQYPTMALDEICALPVAKIATPDAWLFMWATSPKLAEAMRVIEAWGFEYRTCAVWVKPSIGMGYVYRQRHELLLVAKRGSPPVPAPSDRPDSVIEAPDGEHSEKPDLARKQIERMFPKWKWVELFARSSPKGWAVWGNQA